MYALCHCETIGDPRVDFQGDSSGVPNGVSMGVYSHYDDDMCAAYDQCAVFNFGGYLKIYIMLVKYWHNNLAINIIPQYIPCHKLLFCLS